MDTNDSDEVVREKLAIPPGMGTRCFVCGQQITEDDTFGYLREEKKKNNGPIRIPNIPGFVHRYCRITYDGQILNNPISTEDLSGQVKNLIGEKSEK